MIADCLENAALYAFLGPRFAAAFSYLQAFDPASFAPGRHALDGGLVAIHTAYDTRSATGALMEAHRRYADVMLMLEGAEEIAYQPTAALRRPVQAYDPETEASLAEIDADASRLVLQPGHFVVFLPGDGHCPQLHHGAPGHVRKLIVKVPLAD